VSLDVTITQTGGSEGCEKFQNSLRRCHSQATHGQGDWTQHTDGEIPMLAAITMSATATAAKGAAAAVNVVFVFVFVFVFVVVIVIVIASVGVVGVVGGNGRSALVY